MQLLHMVVNSINKIMGNENMLSEENNIKSYFKQVSNEADKFLNIALGVTIAIGIILSFWYDTFVVALSVGPLAVLAVYGSKFIFKGTKVYQYVAGLAFPVLCLSLSIKCMECLKCTFLHL